MPDSGPEGPYPPEYVAFVAAFNRGEYYRCHDLLESAWLEDRRNDYKGLLQLAVGLYHLETGNLAGARSLLETAIGYLAPYPDRHLGLDFAELRAFARALLELLTAADPPGSLATARMRPPHLELR